MNEIQIFRLEQVLGMIEQKLVDDPNSCELSYYIKLKEELEIKLKEYYE